MNEVTFLESTGISFYNPDEKGILLTEKLLNSKQEFFLIQAPQGVMLRAGKVDESEELLGSIEIKFIDALNVAVQKWIPLPYSRKAAAEVSPSKSNDWIRLFISRPPLSMEDYLFNFVFAVDTSVQDNVPHGLKGSDCVGFFTSEMGLPFEAHSSSTSFLSSSTLRTWVENIFKKVAFTGYENPPSFGLALAAFMTLIEGLKKEGILPVVSIIQSEGESVDVHLILDLGNSRACGIIAENEKGKPIQLDECKKLEIRDLSNPALTYTEPFDTSFKFYPSPFSSAENPLSGANFRWPSILRLGSEAAKMESSLVGRTGLSSPKRYLWSNALENYPWYFNLADDSQGQKINSPFFSSLDEFGNYKGDAGAPPFEPRYPTSSMMTFLMLEILNHARAQINSCDYRKFRGRMRARQVLKSIVITTP
ncbi:virulence factor SrfB, partial [Candidatus Riflebacteria bacterium]